MIIFFDYIIFEVRQAYLAIAFVPWCDLIFMQCKNGHRISKHSQVVEGGLHHLAFGGLSITSLLASLVGDMHLALEQFEAKCEAAKMTDSTS